MTPADCKRLIDRISRKLGQATERVARRGRGGFKAAGRAAIANKLSCGDDSAISARWRISSFAAGECLAIDMPEVRQYGLPYVAGDSRSADRHGMPDVRPCDDVRRDDHADGRRAGEPPPRGLSLLTRVPAGRVLRDGARTHHGKQAATLSYRTGLALTGGVFFLAGSEQIRRSVVSSGVGGVPAEVRTSKRQVSDLVHRPPHLSRKRTVAAIGQPSCPNDGFFSSEVT